MLNTYSLLLCGSLVAMRRGEYIVDSSSTLFLTVIVLAPAELRVTACDSSGYLACPDPQFYSAAVLEFLHNDCNSRKQHDSRIIYSFWKRKLPPPPLALSAIFALQGCPYRSHGLGSLFLEIVLTKSSNNSRLLILGPCHSCFPYLGLLQLLCVLLLVVNVVSCKVCPLVGKVKYCQVPRFYLELAPLGEVELWWTLRNVPYNCHAVRQEILILYLPVMLQDSVLEHLIYFPLQGAFLIRLI